MFVFTAYLDESGTHDGSPVTVMGGLLARADQWEKFEKGFVAAQKAHKFRVWHSKKFRQRKGEFRGRQPEELTALYWDLAHLTSYGLTDSVTMTLKNADYEAHYKAGPKPNRARLDTKYGLCFRICLHFFMTEVVKRKYRKKLPPLHVVLEAGHNNYGDAERIFLEVKKDLERQGIYLLRTITKAEKDDCGQLMMADFAAHSEFLLQTKLDASQRHTTPAPSPIPKGMTGITHFESNPEVLAKLRAEIIEKATLRKGPNAPALVMPPDSEGQSS